MGEMAISVSGTGSGRAEGRYEVSPAFDAVSEGEGPGRSDLTGGEAASRELVTGRRIEAEGPSIGTNELVLRRVEAELSGEGLQV